MSLTKYEMKKMIKSPVVSVAIIAVLLLNLYMLLLGSQNPSYTGSGAYRPPFQSDIERRQQEGAYFKGEINDDWFQAYYAEVEAMRNDPANHVSEEEKEQVRRESFWRYTEEAIAEMGSLIYLKESVLHSNEYNKYEDMEFSARFYEYAGRTGFALAENFRETYPGIKGETLAAKTEEMYGFMASDYTAYYNYDLGYEKLRIMHTTLPFTVGLLALIALSPIFAAEYSGKTDALILTSKHGKKRLIFAKFKAGFLFAILAWFVIETINTLIVFGVYGTAGAESYWQNWMIDWSPFPWNQLQITLVTIVTSFFGIVFLAGVIILISSLSKNQFVSLIIGGIILLIPTLSFAFSSSPIFQTIYSLLPTNVLMAIVVWQWFDLAYLFGKAVPVQYLILVVAAVTPVIGMIFGFVAFKHRQVEG